MGEVIMSVKYKTVTQEVNVVSVIICDICNAEIDTVFLSKPYEMNIQGVNALHIQIGGGYGEYMDGELSLTICKSCATEFMYRNPVIKKYLEDCGLL